MNKKQLLIAALNALRKAESLRKDGSLNAAAFALEVAQINLKYARNATH